MKIGIDVSQLGCKWDGIGVYIYNFLKYVMAHPQEHEFYLYSDRPLMKNVRLSKEFHIIADNTYNHMLWLLTKLPKHIKEDKLDVFWQPNFLLPYKVGNTKNIVTVHDMSAYHYWRYASAKTQLTHKLFLKRTCKVADQIVTDSNNSRSELCGCIKMKEEKVTTVYIGQKMFKNGLDASEEESYEYLKICKLVENQYLLFVGTLSPRKNPEVIISAFLKYKELGGKCKLVLAGNVAKSCNRLINKIKKAKTANDIVITGYITEKEKRILYYNCKMVLYPSRLEGFGFPILEAFQAGKPLITSHVSCMPEIAQNAAIYLNDINNSDELTQKIFEVEQMSRENVNQLVALGYERAEYFSAINYPQKLLKIVDNLNDNNLTEK